MGSLELITDETRTVQLSWKETCLISVSTLLVEISRKMVLVTATYSSKHEELIKKWIEYSNNLTFITGYTWELEGTICEEEDKFEIRVESPICSDGTRVGWPEDVAHLSTDEGKKK